MGHTLHQLNVHLIFLAFLQLFFKHAMDPNLSLFEAHPAGSATVQPNPLASVQSGAIAGATHLDLFRVIGRVVGKALLDGQPINAHFTPPFYKLMLGKRLTYYDVRGMDEQYFNNLCYLLDHSMEDNGFSYLTFSEEIDFFGVRKVVELKPGGADISVIDDNKEEYVNLAAVYKMIGAIEDETNAFLDGFW